MKTDGKIGGYCMKIKGKVTDCTVVLGIGKCLLILNQMHHGPATLGYFSGNFSTIETEKPQVSF